MRESTERVVFERYSIVTLILLLFLITLLSLGTRSPLLNVVLGFGPAIVTVLLSLIIFEESGHGKVLPWLLPLLSVPAFYALWTSDLPVAQGISAGDLVGVNVVITLLYLIIFFVISEVLVERHEEKQKDAERTPVEKAQRKAPEHTHTPKTPESNYNRAVLIGEKCKSLNYTIGQVYDRSSNVDKEAREMIRFQREAYNGLVEFYEGKESGDESVTETKAVHYLNDIIRTINKLNKSEKEIFGALHKDFEKLERRSNGEDKIIDVLATNSRSPVYAAVQTLKDTAQAVKEDIGEEE